MKIGLISCVKNKVKHKTKAKDLYISSLFKKSRMYSENNYDKYYILSALHGLVEPNQELEPYDFTLIGQSTSFKKEWSSKVANQIFQEIEMEAELYIHTGSDYRKFLVPFLENLGYKIVIPLQGMGIGQQLQFYTTHNKKCGD